MTNSKPLSGAIYAHVTPVGTTEPVLVVDGDMRVRFVNDGGGWEPSTAIVRPIHDPCGGTFLGVAGDRRALVTHAAVLRRLSLEDLIGQQMFTRKLPPNCWLVAVSAEQLRAAWPQQGEPGIIDTPAQERGRRSHASG